MLVDAAVYLDGARLPGPKDPAWVAETLATKAGSWTWMGLFEPTRPEYAQVCDAVHPDPDAVEDALQPHQRPILVRHEDQLYFVLKPAHYLDNVEDIELGEIRLFLGQDFLVHVRHRSPSKLVGVRSRLEADPEQVALGPGAALLAITEHVVDGYEPILAELQKDVNDAEREVFSSRGGRNPVERIYGLMRTVLDLRLVVEPLIGPLDLLASRPLPPVHPDLRPDFRAVHDQLVRIAGEIQYLHELLASALTANLTRVSVRQNEDMRKISAWVAIVAVPTLISGMYGMNFEHIPLAGHTLGFFVLVGTMFTVCALLWRAFRRAEWL
jgi:magnesium transporter